MDYLQLTSLCYCFVLPTYLCRYLINYVLYISCSTFSYNVGRSYYVLHDICRTGTTVNFYVVCYVLPMYFMYLPNYVLLVCYVLPMYFMYLPNYVLLVYLCDTYCTLCSYLTMCYCFLCGFLLIVLVNLDMCCMAYADSGPQPISLLYYLFNFI